MATHEAPRVEVPKPHTFSGKRDAKELDNFLWHMERYFEAIALTDEATKDFESIVEMFSRFLVIVNELEALGKTYTEVEKVMKILRSLPKKWETKVTVIQEAKDLTKLSLEELIGSLMTYEIELYNHQRVEEIEKSIAFMAITNDNEEEESESESDEVETMTSIISRGSHALEDSDTDACHTGIVDIIRITTDVMCIIWEDYHLPHVEHRGGR
ncbi:hypothetical protein VitviT2T_008789 [Vitis vinifera]|uniref:Uncharacterized protein n=1 Tax=Vitis vinifera TaxID=29760 RepID=A0ABY9C2W3_VITVI|nr:hypothetical protein VitviT2T_008789 [Vitis vinifera]